MKKNQKTEVAVFDFPTVTLRVHGRPEALKRIKSFYAAIRLFHSTWLEETQVAYILGFMESMTVSFQMIQKSYYPSVLGYDVIDRIIARRKRDEK